MQSFKKGIVMLRKAARALVNRCLQVAGLRMISADWGPRGFQTTFQEIKASGWAPKMVVDVGAWNGVWTRECQAIFPDANYLMIDPLPQNAPKLASFSASDPKVEHWSGALGPSAGTMPFHFSNDQSSFYASDSFPASAVKEVDVLPLDELLLQKGMAQPDLIKMDVQGYELEVARGAPLAMASAEVVLLEVSYRQVYEDAPLMHDVVGWMGEAGFRVYDIATYAQRPKDGALYQSDIIFAKTSSGLFSPETYE